MQLKAKLNNHNLYLLGLITIAVSLPMSPFFTSIGQWIMLLAWLSDGNVTDKLNNAIRNRALQIFLIFFLVHIVSIIWTTDYAYAIKDLKIKLPMLILPFIISTSKQLTKKELNNILILFTLSVFIVSGIGIAKLYHIDSGVTGNYRGMSPFISHIRFSLMINLSIVILMTIAVNKIKTNILLSIISIAIIIYLILFMVMMRSLTGFAVLSALLLFMLIYIIVKTKSEIIKWTLSVVSIFIMLLAISYVVRSYAKFSYRLKEPFNNLKTQTVNGNKYYHDTLSSEHENEYLVNINICPTELRQEWNKVSSINYDTPDNNYQLKNTLCKYLTSKGLDKDSAGISKLTKQDIKAIENGISNYIYLDNISLYPRLYELFKEIEIYREGGVRGGHSMLQRLSFVEAGWSIFLENKIIGVGVGDVKQSFDKYYTDTNSTLEEKYRLRAHNQYLTLLLSFGIIGFSLIFCSQFYPAYAQSKRGQLSKYFLPFIVIALVSMINEDTLETQAGATFYALFYSLFTWGVNENELPKST